MNKHSRALSLGIMLVVMACNNDTVTGLDRVIGMYSATTFTEPGQHDGGVDILVNGGILTARLRSNYEVEGHLLIPENIGSNFTATDVDYYGEFNLDGDNIHFVNTETFLDQDPYIFIIRDSRLETPDWTGRWAPTKIILDKQL
jgi:hypothetical protein